MGYGQHSATGSHDGRHAKDAIATATASTSAKSSGRIKRVFADEKEIAHLWFHQAQDSARNRQGTFYFSGDTIYSYGSHFPIARLVVADKGKRKGEKAVLFTARTYHGPTTTKHIKTVWSAIRTWNAGATSIYNGTEPLCTDCQARQGEQHYDHCSTRGKWEVVEGWRVFNVSHLDDNIAYVLTSYEARIKEAGEAVIKPRIRRDTRDKAYTNLLSLIQEANEYAEFVNERKRFAVPASLETLAVELKDAEKRAVVAQRREDAKREKERVRVTAEAREQYAEALPQWIAGEIRRLPWNPDGDKQAYLRLFPICEECRHSKNDHASHQHYCEVGSNEHSCGCQKYQPSKEVETSQGVHFPLSHAVRAIRLLRPLMEFRVPHTLPGDEPLFVRNGHSIRLGHYQIDRIEADGTIHAGCHVVTRAEFERFSGIVERYLMTHPITGPEEMNHA